MEPKSEKKQMLVLTGAIKELNDYVKSYRRRGGTSHEHMRNFIRDGIYWLELSVKAAVLINLF